MGTAFAPLQITVEDSYGNAVGAGTSVTFTAPVSGAGGTFASSGTNAAALQTAANGTISRRLHGQPHPWVVQRPAIFDGHYLATKLYVDQQSGSALANRN